VNIRIGNIFQLYLQHSIWGLSDSVKRRINTVGRWGPMVEASACTDCGVCVPKCPQDIDIPAELKRVWPILKGL